jgi:hypothetical protein
VQEHDLDELLAQHVAQTPGVAGHGTARRQRDDLDPSRANDCSAAESAQQATRTGSPRAASPRAAAAKARAEPDHPCAV